MLAERFLSERLPLWHRDKPAICARIAKHFAPLKIVLKTRDEPARLKTWITHHAAIAGIENLIIFDHNSIDPHVLDIYEQYEGQFPVFRFEGFLDTVHNAAIFPELYEALRASCLHYCFLDTDEHLAMYDGADRFEMDERIPAFLGRHADAFVFPGTWLQSVAGCADRFGMGQPFAALSDGLKWGKPVISAAFEPSGIMLHNTEVKRGMAKDDLKTCLFVLHRHMNVPAERIRANLLKLKSFGVIEQNDGVERVLALELDSYKMGRNYIREIQQLSVPGDAQPPVNATIRIGTNGEINWSSQAQRIAMGEFLAEPFRYSEMLFS